MPGTAASAADTRTGAAPTAAATGRPATSTVGTRTARSESCASSCLPPYAGRAPVKERPVAADGTKHPTVKPLSVMRWLVRLVTPHGGTVLDMFTGSGTTLEAAVLEGRDAIGFESHAPFIPLIEQRLARCGAEVAS